MHRITPKLVLIRGLPGSGKSHLVEALKKHFKPDEIVCLDPDASDYDSTEYKQLTNKLKAEGVDEKFYPYRYLRAQAHDGIESGKIIFWNQAFTNLDGFEKTVKNLSSHASENGLELPILVVEVVINEQTAQKRIKDRVTSGGHDVPDDRFKQFANDYQSFEQYGYKVVQVNGEDTVEKSCDAVLKALQNLY